MNRKTAIVCVIDAVGLETLSFLIKNYKSTVNIPFLRKAGIHKLLPKDVSTKIKKNISNSKIKSIVFSFNQKSKTADSLIGHREMVGIIDTREFNLFPNGFPKHYINELEKRIKRKTFFNKMAGGIEAIEKNYEYHEKTGYPIVYASKCDPLIQLAMNEDIIPLKEQKFIADTALNLALEMGIPITRAIARSYIRKGNEIIRTPNRYDAVLPLTSKTLIDLLNEEKIWTVAVGKTADLVNTNYYEKIKLTSKEFIDPSLKLTFIHPSEKDTNIFNIQGIINAIKEKKALYRPNGTFIFANLVDTDSLWGHTRDINGAIKSIEQIDKGLEIIFKTMENDDVLIITSDHGMEHRQDYGYHSNEKLFIIMISKKDISKYNHILKSFEGLTRVGGLVSSFFNVEKKYRSLITKI